jgi:hypothetical protein
MILVIVVVLDFLSAYLLWRKEHMPAVIEIDKMLGEIEGSMES